MTDNFHQELRGVRSKEQFDAFIKRHADNPIIKQARQMCQGQNGMSVAERLAGSMKMDFGELKKSFGFNAQ